jgi:aminoglycoside phosphotransferase family enzyme/predicted kinase
LITAAGDELLQGLRRPDAYPHPVDRIRIIETHISWILLTGQFAYKVKKPVRLGFLDFSTLDARHQACNEELRLNRRLAPDLYLAVWGIDGAPHAPRLGPGGSPFEYAVRMRQFPDDAVLDRQLDQGRLGLADMEALARTIADFHRELEPAHAGSPWGEPESVWAPIAESLDELEARPELAAQAVRLRTACQGEFEARRAALSARRLAGLVRECHGDLHLGNLVRLGDHLTAFDALEFDPALRWTDVMCEVAFLVMDLSVHQRPDLAWRFLNSYLAVTGDYPGLEMLRLFLCYRALVRAKIAALRPAGVAPALELLRWAADPGLAAPRLIVTCGVSGSGKTWLARRLADALPAVHLRSDVERKRLFGLEALARSGSGLGRGLYAPGATEATYRRLGELAAAALTAGFPVIVDATCGRATQRAPLIDLARRLGVPCTLLHCTANPGVLRARVEARARAGADASEADLDVLDRQLRRFEPPDAAEGSPVLVVDTAASPDAQDILVRLRRR